jgi:hypothetical protein
MKSSGIKAALATVALGVVLSSSALATTIYDNGAPDQANGNEMTHWLQTEDFSVGSTSTLNGAEFWTLEAPGVSYDGTLQWTIFSDNAGNPGAIIATGVVDPNKVSTGNMVLGYYNECDYTFNTTSVSLTAGTVYHLGLHLNTSENYQNIDGIYWETTGDNGTTSGIESESGTMDNWNNNGQEHAFKLYDTPVAPVPEPSSMMLLLPGLGGLGVLFRRRK